MEGGEVLLVLNCKASDFDAATGVCAAPFYGPAPAILPRLSAADGAILSALIVGAWAIGFTVKQARNVSST